VKRTEVPDVLVVGGGPAGMAAAIVASEYGAKVRIVDENAWLGGQLVKQTHKFFGSARHYAGSRGIDICARLVKEAEERDVEVMLDSPVVGVFDGLVVVAERQERLAAMRPGCTILATGAGENAIAFPGWTLPGVMTAGAAQTFVNVHRIRIGHHAVVAGSGNVGLIVAYQLEQAGISVAAIVEAMPSIGGWGVHAAKVRRLGIPILTGHTIAEARGTEHVESVIIQRVDKAFRPVSGAEEILEADIVCLAVGMNPRTRLAEMAGCTLMHVPALGGKVPVHSAGMETSIPGFFVAGDISGIEEASTAIEEGRLAGLSAARTLEAVSGVEYEERRSAYIEALAELRSGPFGLARREAKEEVVKSHERRYA
jgi:NADPH-dependent 2,4-dienoyl-CoA reductase/sulfur reductase-like enzyme